MTGTTVAVAVFSARLPSPSQIFKHFPRASNVECTWIFIRIE